MIICCSNCATKFKVPDNAIAHSGRFVHCTYCDAEWLVTPDSDDIIKESIVELDTKFESNNLQKTLGAIRRKTKEALEYDKERDRQTKKTHFTPATREDRVKISTIVLVLVLSVVLLCATASWIYFDFNKLKIKNKFPKSESDTLALDQIIKSKSIDQKAQYNELGVNELELLQNSTSPNSIDQKNELKFTITNKSKKMQIISKTQIIGFDRNEKIITKTVDMTHKILYPDHNIRFYVKLDENAHKNIDKILILINDRFVAKSNLHNNHKMQK